MPFHTLEIIGTEDSWFFLLEEVWKRRWQMGSPSCRVSNSLINPSGGLKIEGTSEGAR